MGACTLETARSASATAVAPTCYQYLSVGTFAEGAVVPASAVVPIPASVPFDVACLIGCSATTGVGAASTPRASRPGRRSA